MDLTDVHSVSAVTPSAGALGTLTASVSTDTTGSGMGGVVTWNYSVAAAPSSTWRPGQTKVETFTFMCSTAQGGSVPRTVSVTITGTNDAPVVAAADVTGAVTEAGHPGRQPHRHGHDRLHRRGPDRRPQPQRGDAFGGCAGHVDGERDH